MIPSRRGSGVSKRKGKGKGQLPSLPAQVPNDWVPTTEDLEVLFEAVKSPDITDFQFDLSWLHPLDEALPHGTELPPFVISEVQEPTEAELDDFLGLSSAPVVQESLEDVVQSALDTSVASDDKEPIAVIEAELRTDADSTFSLENIPVDVVDAVLMSL